MGNSMPTARGISPDLWHDGTARLRTAIGTRDRLVDALGAAGKAGASCDGPPHFAIVLTARRGRHSRCSVPDHSGRPLSPSSGAWSPDCCDQTTFGFAVRTLLSHGDP